MLPLATTSEIAEYLTALNLWLKGKQMGYPQTEPQRKEKEYMATCINPTVGRMVWYVPAAVDKMTRDNSGYCAAIVTRVWNDRMVNLTVFDGDGNGHPRTSVVLLQEGDDAPEGCRFCRWMPFQLGQAKKTEAAEAVAKADAELRKAARGGFHGTREASE